MKTALGRYQLDRLVTSIKARCLLIDMGYELSNNASKFQLETKTNFGERGQCFKWSSWVGAKAILFKLRKLFKQFRRLYSNILMLARFADG